MKRVEDAAPTPTRRAQLAMALRSLAAEIRQAATRHGLEPLLPPPPGKLAWWSEQLEELAAEAERGGVPEDRHEQHASRVYVLVEGDSEAESVLGVYASDDAARRAAEARAGEPLVWRRLELTAAEAARHPRNPRWFFRVDPYRLESRDGVQA